MDKIRAERSLKLVNSCTFIREIEALFVNLSFVVIGAMGEEYF